MIDFWKIGIYNKIMNTLEEYLEIKTIDKNFYVKNNKVIDNEVSNDKFFECVSYDVDIVFNILNISPNKSGYKYFKEAIFLYLFFEKDSPSFSKEIYPAIAKKYNKSTMAIERAMRLSFENVMYHISREKENYITEYLKPYLLYPHNGEIVAKIVKLISSKYFQDNKDKFFNI